MMVWTLRAVRRGLLLAWLLLIAGLAGLVAGPHVASLFDRHVYVVRGGSMAPAIPLGALIIVRATEPAGLTAGDVITFTSDSGTVVTHRIVGADPGNPPAFHTKGDSSLATDPLVVTADAIVGIVEGYLPLAGFLLAFLSTTTGSLATIGLLGGLLLAVWFVDELLITLREASRRREVVAEPVR